MAKVCSILIFLFIFVLIESQVAESRYHYAPCEDLTDAVMDYMDYTDRRHSADIHGLVKNLTGIDYKDIQLMTELVCDFVGSTDVFVHKLRYMHIEDQLVRTAHAYVVLMLKSQSVVSKFNLKNLDGDDSYLIKQYRDVIQLTDALKLRGWLDLDPQWESYVRGAWDQVLGMDTVMTNSEDPDPKNNLTCPKIVDLATRVFDLPHGYLHLYVIKGDDIETSMERFICDLAESKSMKRIQEVVEQYRMPAHLVQIAKFYINHLDWILEYWEDIHADATLSESDQLQYKVLTAARRAGLFLRRITASGRW